MPAPKVDSAVIRIDLYDTPKYELRDEVLFKKLIKYAFEMRRKTLLNALTSKLSVFSKEQVLSAIVSIGHDEKVRGEKLSTEDYVELANFLSRMEEL
jgi:16S rRNA (adenine1518-N6/adenine1519-N6)-dimethyltransferase